MNSFTRFFSILFFVGFSITLYASVEPVLNLKHKTRQSFILKIEGLQNENCSVDLIDQNGFILQSEKIEDQDVYKKLYNLKNLPVGNYLIKVNTKRKIMLQEIKVVKRYLNAKLYLDIDASLLREIYKPTLEYDFPSLDLNMLHFEKGVVTVNLIDKKAVNLYNDQFEAFGSINKRFIIGHLPVGDYVFELITDFYTFKQKFSIEKNKITPKIMTRIAGK